MPPWPFGQRQLPSLSQITDATPHRFRIWVADADADRATALLHEPRWAAGELQAIRPGDPTGRGVPVDLESTFSPRTAAILRPLNALHGGGVGVIGFEALDVVTDVDDRALAEAVASWDANANRGPHRHRLEVLAGTGLLARCLARFEAAKGRGPDGRPAWRFATICVAFNTDGSEERLLQAALDAPADDASSLVDPIINRAQVAGLTGSPMTLPDEPLAALIRRRTYVGERAAHLAWHLAAPLSETVVDALCDAAHRGGEASEPAISALAHAAPSDRVRDTLNRILAGDDAGARAAALGPLADHWPDEARSVWREFLASRSAPLRWAGEQTLGLHGEEEDLPDAVAHLAKLVRTKPSMQMSPPRGAEIVELLLRHRDRPDAGAGLDDLVARWDRLGEDMRRWIQAKQPDLHPDRWRAGSEALSAADGEPEEPLTWPPPTIERDGDAWLLSFDDATARSATRERFEDLARAAPAFEVLDGDGEWLRVRIGPADPHRAVRDLWQESGPG